MHIIIYTTALTPRIKYIFNFIFKDILNTEIEFTSTADYFLASEHLKISYAEKPLSNEVFFKCSNFLLSQKVEPISLIPIKFGDYSVPFEVKNSALPFDVFAASFFILTRYEEYLHNEELGSSFKATDSLQYKWNLLEKPIIDEWALMIKNILLKKHPDYKFVKKTFFHQETINFNLKPDKPKGLILKSKRLFQSVFDKKAHLLSNFFDNVIGLGTDVKAIMATLAPKIKQANTIYFVGFPANLHQGDEFTKSSPLLNGNTIGLLRPRLPELTKTNALKASIDQLKQISDQPQHIISQQLDSLKIPSCYLHLISSGIISDYSMGYHNNLGFRAGTCTPFYWYDLQLDKVTSLCVKSYCMSDIALQKLNTETIEATIKDFIIAVELVNGHFYSSWQLKSFAENANFKKLKRAFEVVLKYTSS